MSTTSLDRRASTSRRSHRQIHRTRLSLLFSVLDTGLACRLQLCLSCPSNKPPPPSSTHYDAVLVPRYSMHPPFSPPPQSNRYCLLPTSCPSSFVSVLLLSLRLHCRVVFLPTLSFSSFLRENVLCEPRRIHCLTVFHAGTHPLPNSVIFSLLGLDLTSTLCPSSHIPQPPLQTFFFFPYFFKFDRRLICFHPDS